MNKEQIPEFAREDFLNSEAPYKWLEENSVNKFEEMQLTEMLSEKAKEKGVTNFKALLKAYKESKKGSDLIINSTNFTGQEIQLDSGTWNCDDFGVTSYDRSGEIIACNHPIMPVKRLVNIDSDTEKLKLAYKKGTRWRSIIADKKVLASNNQILQLADVGIAVNSENSRYLIRYLADIEAMNYDRIPELNSVGRLGWVRHKEFSPYVKNLVFDGDVTFKHFFESVKEHGKYEKWLNVAKTVRRDKSIPARIMLASAFASVLVEPCGSLPFFVHLWGNTEGGKTVALMLAASVWANPRMGEYVHSFNGTGVAQELSAVFVNSLPLILDELQILKEKKDFDQMIYQLTEGVGRQRGAKAGGLQKTGTWSNCILTSGEMPISSSASGGGAVNRIIDVEYSDKLFSDPVYVAETVKGNYGYAGKEFIEYISNDDTMEEIRQKHKQLTHELQQSESTDKQSISASLILTADFFAERFIFKDGITLGVDDIKPFLSTKTDVSQNLRAYEFIMDTVTMNVSKFLPDANENTEIWGTRDAEYVYIIATKFNELLRNAGFNAVSVLSYLKKNDLIECEKTRKDKVKKINGMSRRCVWLKLQDIYDAWDGFEKSNEDENIFK